MEEQEKTEQHPGEKPKDEALKNKEITEKTKKEEKETEIKKEKKPFNLLSSIREVYDKHYKVLMVFPFIILLLAIFSIAFQTITTGDFINRDVTLKGGLTITIPSENQIDVSALQEHLSRQFPSNMVSIRKLKRAGSDTGIIIDSDIGEADSATLGLFISEIEKSLGTKLEREGYTVEFIGSSLGASFFKETVRALVIAFILMGIVVFITFRVFVPSIAVILAAFSDIVITIAVVNLIGMRISTAGIAAFLMLIGYSVDTDILLTTRLLKRKEGTEMERVLSAVKTGVMMTLTTSIAITVGMIFTESDVIREIMIILLIVLIADLMNTWIQNVGILRLY